MWTHHFANKDLNNGKVGNEIAYFFIKIRKVVLVAKIALLLRLTTKGRSRLQKHVFSRHHTRFFISVSYVGPNQRVIFFIIMMKATFVITIETLPTYKNLTFILTYSRTILCKKKQTQYAL